MAIAKTTTTENTTTTTEEGGGCHPDERDFWLSLGLGYCEKCCNPRGTDADGRTHCRIEQPETCPLILQE
jgi:hypothetical protein